MTIKQVGDRLVLIPDVNKVVTDGKEIYSLELWLNVGGNKDDFYEISQVEYEEILRQQEEAIQENEEMLFI